MVLLTLAPYVKPIALIRSLLLSSLDPSKWLVAYNSSQYRLSVLLNSILSRLLHILRMLTSVVSPGSTTASILSILWNAIKRVSHVVWNIFDWLVLPKQLIQLCVRHSVAIIILWVTHMFIKRAIVPASHQIYLFLRPLWLPRAYLRAEASLMDKMNQARTYPEWKKAASELDRLQGHYEWKESSRSPYYDWRRIRDDLKRFRELVDNRDVKGIMQYSRSRLLRNLVGINDRRLYTYLRAGTKRLIEEYISEVVRALQLVCVVDDEEPDSPTSNVATNAAAAVIAPTSDAEEVDGSMAVTEEEAQKRGRRKITMADKLSFFNETRHAFGRSALLLSGGATLGLYHLGVVKSLFENNLLPRVLSGSSVGSIVNAMIGTRTDEELRELFNDPRSINLDFFPPNDGTASIRRKLNRLMTQGVLMDIGILKECVKANVPNYTFQEAYDRTGRIINIVVSPAKGSGNQDSLRLLNYLTAPNVLVWSASLASCAIPGVYAPVELLAKDENGRIHKYLEGAVKWEDGSVQADLPMERLSELFNINHFIVSQVNPHVVPFLSNESSTHHYHLSFLSSPLVKLIHFLSTEIKSAIVGTYDLDIMPLHGSLRAIIDQKYVGDITIVPDVKWADYPQLLTNPTADRLSHCLSLSERSTWKMIPIIRGACEIEFTLDECVRRMRGLMILDELKQQQQQQQLHGMTGDATNTNAPVHMPHTRQSMIFSSATKSGLKDISPNTSKISLLQQNNANLTKPAISRVRSWSTDLLGKAGQSNVLSHVPIAAAVVANVNNAETPVDARTMKSGSRSGSRSNISAVIEEEQPNRGSLVNKSSPQSRQRNSFEGKEAEDEDYHSQPQHDNSGTDGSVSTRAPRLSGSRQVSFHTDNTQESNIETSHESEDSDISAPPRRSSSRSSLTSAIRVPNFNMVGFRHTPARKMSTMDLSKLDDFEESENEDPVDEGAWYMGNEETSQKETSQKNKSSRRPSITATTIMQPAQPVVQSNTTTRNVASSSSISALSGLRGTDLHISGLHSQENSSPNSPEFKHSNHNNTNSGSSSSSISSSDSLQSGPAPSMYLNNPSAVESFNLVAAANHNKSPESPKGWSGMPPIAPGSGRKSSLVSTTTATTGVTPTSPNAANASPSSPNATSPSANTAPHDALTRRKSRTRSGSFSNTEFLPLPPDPIHGVSSQVSHLLQVDQVTVPSEEGDNNATKS